MEFSKSAFQTPVTIKEVVENIHRKKYLLPAIQREFVWNQGQMVRLFDSLMRDYTIGSFLFWSVDKSKVNDFQFYEFIRKYHERDGTHNPKANVTGEDNITSILDGQQRLTAFYIALKGSYAEKIPWKRRNNNDAYPLKKLYLNLLSKSDEFDLLYDFRFLTSEETSMQDPSTHWYEVGKILEFTSLRDINRYLRDNDLLQSEFAEECLFKLYEMVHERRVINYYLETSQELDKVLNIFIRVNSGGTKLSYSDLLLSIATAQWKTKDAREEITSFVDEINRVGGGFDFSKDFVLKSCLILTDITDIAFKVDNFRMSNMKKIEDNWEDIKKAIKLTVDLVSSIGYNSKTLTSDNALIPIAYYIKTKGGPSGFVQSGEFREDRKLIEKWLRLALIKRTFSGQPDNVLRPIRNIIRANNSVFPIEAIVDNFKGTQKTFSVTVEEVESLLSSAYGKDHTFSVLALLYPNLDYRNQFHMDHIFPRSFFKPRELKKRGISDSDAEFYLENHDYLANLQLLEGLPNEEKSNKDFKEWLKDTYPNQKEKKDCMKKNYIPDSIGLDFNNFKEVFEERNKLILRKLKEILM